MEAAENAADVSNNVQERGEREEWEQRKEE